MKTPLKLFWTLLKTMYRIQASESLRWLNILSMPNVSDDMRKSFVAEQLRVLGTVQVADERDEEAASKLKNLM